MTRERAIQELSRSEYDFACLLVLTITSGSTKFDNNAEAREACGGRERDRVSGDIDTSSNTTVPKNLVAARRPMAANPLHGRSDGST